MSENPTNENHEQKHAGPQSDAAGVGLLPVSEVLPNHLFLVPVSQTTLFPGMIVPFILPEGKLSKTIDHVLEKSTYLGVVVTPGAGDAGTSPPTPASVTAPADAANDYLLNPANTFGIEVLRYGVAGKILKRINLPDNQVSVLIQGLQRFELKSIIAEEPHWVGTVDYLYEENAKGMQLEALMRSCLAQFKQISKDNPLISEEVKVALVNIDGPGKLADFMASVLVRDLKDYQEMLETADVKVRLEILLLLLKKELEVQTIQRKIQDEINQKVSSAQREFYLQEQLKSIQRELGRFTDEKAKLVDKFRSRLKDKKVSEEVSKRIDEEIERLSSLHEQSSEYSVSISYLDWLTQMPWGVRTQDRLELNRARRILDQDHYGLKEVKERILEFLAVRKLKGKTDGSILCFVGPPGAGKTSLGRSIARAMGRKFFRFSVGGMRDEAEIKGHRRTYVGAMPGKMVQGLKRVGAQNPVFLIDEIDKIGSQFTTGGDPASALLELLDPEQNSEFLDHYLDVPVDCSEALFITTANSLETIPAPLQDRMEMIFLSGYTDHEKMEIARRHLIPKLLDRAGIQPDQLSFTDAGLKFIISHYAREAGVRNLEKQLARICRKFAFRLASRKLVKLRVDTPKEIEKLLGVPPFSPETEHLPRHVGVATGLAWTQYGGDTLSVESAVVQGKGGIVLTGTLGQVMQESASIAYTFVRSRAADLNLEKGFFDHNLFHVHVPAGAIPKDGPSAGITIATSLYSLLAKKSLSRKLAMTGELTLTGRVLPVGGIKEKLLAAKRAGLREIILPSGNQRDYKQLDRDLAKGLDVHFAASMEDVLSTVFPKKSVSSTVRSGKHI